MLALPVSLIVSLVLAFLLVRMMLTEPGRPWPIPALLIACMVQGVLGALGLYYGVTWARFIQPVTASAIPPLAWLAFRNSVERPADQLRDLSHFAVTAFTLFCAIFAPHTLDIVLPGIFLAYGLAMLIALRSGSDALPMARLESGDWPRQVWRAIAFSLILSMASDLAIAALNMTGHGWLQPWIVSVVTSITLLMIGALSLSRELDADTSAPPAESEPLATPGWKDAEIISRLEELLIGQNLFLDADLSLSRLSRRLRIPAKQLSAAINRATGQNVSRYVNALRIRHACARLKAGGNVTTAMLESGFNTKSNFNREFQRITGKSPTAWLETERSLAGPDNPVPNA